MRPTSQGSRIRRFRLGLRNCSVCLWTFITEAHPEGGVLHLFNSTYSLVPKGMVVPVGLGLGGNSGGHLAKAKGEPSHSDTPAWIGVFGLQGLFAVLQRQVLQQSGQGAHVLGCVMILGESHKQLDSDGRSQSSPENPSKCPVFF